jgi:uncharacterized protein (UPF0332 family)
MIDIEWCKKQKAGIREVEPSEDMAKSYLEMAETTLRELKNVKTNIWKTSMVYYVVYYSLYSLMMKVGVKCEIHSCSIEFMKQYLKDYYSIEDIGLIEQAFEERNKAQYYPEEQINKKELEINAGDFFVKTKEIVGKISDSEIEKIREMIK